MEECFPESVTRDVRVDAELWSQFIFYLSLEYIFPEVGKN